jgi:hypothetical protein
MLSLPARSGTYPACLSKPPYHLKLVRWRYPVHKGSYPLANREDGPYQAFLLDFTNSALERKPAGGSMPIRLVASITVLPVIPCSLSRASAIAPPGTATSTNTQFVTAKGRCSGQAQYPFRGDAAHQTRGMPVPEAQEAGLPSVCQATGFWSNMSRIC